MKKKITKTDKLNSYFIFHKIKVPKGWRRVLRGVTHKGDKMWNSEGYFGKIEAFPEFGYMQYGESIFEYYCVIRKIE